MRKRTGRVIKCEVCGKEKTVFTIWAKYCSNVCRQIGWALQKKKEIDLKKPLDK